MGGKEFTDNFLNDIEAIVEHSKQLYETAEKLFAPMVDSIIQNNCTDSRIIEKLMDDMISFTSDDKILILFKRLCRYTYPIDSELVYDYINIYKKMWEEE